MDLGAFYDYEDAMYSANTEKTSFIDSIHLDDFIRFRTPDLAICIKVVSKTPGNGDVSLTGPVIYNNGLNGTYVYYGSNTLPDIITRGTVIYGDDYEIQDADSRDFNNMLDEIIHEIQNM